MAERDPAPIFVTGMAMGSFLALMFYGLSPRDPETHQQEVEKLKARYNNQYIFGNGCLSDSNFDPNEGAKVMVSKHNDNQLVTVSNPDVPDQLHLQMHDGKLRSTDYVTSAYLGQYACANTEIYEFVLPETNQ